MTRRRRKWIGVGIVVPALSFGAIVTLRPDPPAPLLNPPARIARAFEKPTPKAPALYLGADRPLLREEPALLAETKSVDLPPVTMSPIGPLMETIASDEASSPASSGYSHAGWLSSAPLRLPDLPVSVNAGGGLPDLSRQYPEAQFAFAGTSGGSSSAGGGAPGFPELDQWDTFPAGRGIKSINNPGINPSPIYPPFTLPPVTNTSVPEPATVTPLLLTLGMLFARRARGV